MSYDETHSINGVFTPFLGHFQSAKIIKEQMNELINLAKKASLNDSKILKLLRRRCILKLYLVLLFQEMSFVLKILL